jgi:hypothetical protein
VPRFSGQLAKDKAADLTSTPESFRGFYVDFASVSTGRLNNEDADTPYMTTAEKLGLLRCSSVGAHTSACVLTEEGQKRSSEWHHQSNQQTYAAPFHVPTLDSVSVVQDSDVEAEALFDFHRELTPSGKQFGSAEAESGAAYRGKVHFRRHGNEWTIESFSPPPALRQYFSS